MDEDPWYESLRLQWRPARVRLLLIGESAPDVSAAPAARRFFYAPILTRADNLYRAVVFAMYTPQEPLRAGDLKEPWLARLKADGVYLIDAAPYPINHLTAARRRQVRLEHADACVAQAQALQPDGVVVCHGPTFEDLASRLRTSGLPVLHSEALPFPLGNHRARFIAGFNAAVKPGLRVDSRLSRSQS